jgi:hypothetical protein
MQSMKVVETAFSAELAANYVLHSLAASAKADTA